MRLGLLFVVLLQCAIVSAEGIVLQPENQTVFLGSHAVFRCEIDGVQAAWKFNNTLIDNITPDTRQYLDRTQYPSSQGLSLLVLTISARLEMNMTSVQCVSTHNNSDIVFIIIQGHVHGVSSLNAAILIQLSWTAPFSLNLTESDPNIWYSVSIYNVTDGNNPTTVNCTDCTNITDSQYTFSPKYFNPSHQYNFVVTTYNGAGEGETSSILFHGKHMMSSRVSIDSHGTNIAIQCTSERTQQKKCYITLERIKIITREERCFEEDGELGSVFVGAEAGMYVVSAYYGLHENSDNCNPSGEPDLITIFQHNPTPLISSSIHTDNIDNTFSLCTRIFVTGIGIGVIIGVVATSLFCLLVVLIISKYHTKRKAIRARGGRDNDTKMTLDKNMAYELHALKDSGYQISAIPIYEDLK